MKTALICTYALAIVVLTTCSHPSPAAKAAPVVWTIVPGPGMMASGTDTVVIRGVIEPGWHVYALTQPPGGPFATRVALPDGQPLEVTGTPVSEPAPHTAYDEAFRMNVQMYENEVRLLVPVRATRVVTPADSVRVNVRYQICNASLCYPAQTVRLAAAVPAARS